MLAIEIETLARRNEDFRREVATAEHSQVILMSIPPGEEIGEEVHDGIDQLLVSVDGEAEAIIEGGSSGVRRAEALRGSPLRLWTVCAPPEHAPEMVHGTKAEADAAEHVH
jgi:mannose-6-phosphate isomerase-like protein (cupin superfamily)